MPCTCSAPSKQIGFVSNQKKKEAKKEEEEEKKPPENETLLFFPIPCIFHLGALMKLAE